MTRLGGLRSALALLLASLAIACGASQAPPADHAVVLLYHHVDDTTPPSTSVTPERFGEHLDWLAANGYRVLPLDDLLDAMSAGDAVPDRAVAITFDDGWVSVHDSAAPMLAERDWPFTVFVNTDGVDAGEGPVMTWDQIRAVAAMGGAIESHSASHAHLPARRPGESTSEWERRIDADLARAARRIEQETGRRPTLFAYPYGEDSRALAERVRAVHDYALVQRSGAVGYGTDVLAVPRFPMATGFDELERFERAVRARPLPVREASNVPPGDGVRDVPLAGVELVLDEGGYRLDALACYSSSGKALPLHRPADSAARRVRVETRGLDREGRNKINCTAPASDGSGDWYWFSHQWLRPPLE